MKPSLASTESLGAIDGDAGPGAAAVGESDTAASATGHAAGSPGVCAEHETEKTIDLVALAEESPDRPVDSAASAAATATAPAATTAGTSTEER
eukprot:gene11947-8530_t